MRSLQINQASPYLHSIQTSPPFTMRTTVVFHASQEVKMIDGLKQIRQ
jgi:hypothetical protein